MSLDADAIVDRRRMRRKLTFWRVSAVLIAVARGRRRAVAAHAGQPADAGAAPMSRASRSGA